MRCDFIETLTKRSAAVHHKSAHVTGRSATAELRSENKRHCPLRAMCARTNPRWLPPIRRMPSRRDPWQGDAGIDRAFLCRRIEVMGYGWVRNADGGVRQSGAQGAPRDRKADSTRNGHKFGTGGKLGTCPKLDQGRTAQKADLY
jgi:hypothetical protein